MTESSMPADDTNAITVPPMPEMRQGLLNQDDLRALCDDLTQLTQIVSVQTRVRGNTNARAASDELSDLIDELWIGNLQALQIRYRYDNHEWTDTLLRADCRVRVVRCQHPHA